MPVFFEGGIVGPECVRLTRTPGCVEPFFLNNVLHLISSRRPLHVQRGKREMAIDLDMLRRLMIKLPPLPEQRESPTYCSRSPARSLPRRRAHEVPSIRATLSAQKRIKNNRHFSRFCIHPLHYRWRNCHAHSCINIGSSNVKAVMLKAKAPLERGGAA